MNKKFIGIIIVIIGVFLLIGIAYFVFFNNNAGNQAVNNPVNQNTDNPDATKPAPVNNPVIPKIKLNNNAKNTAATAGKTVGKEDLKMIASLFAERFGSFSNQSGFSNINDLKIFMSKKMQAWASGYLNEQNNKKNYNAIYYGITTKAISEEVKNYDEDSGLASILVKTRRREANGTTNNISNIFNQEIIINLIKENGIWKVDSANWGTK
jgi:hypothetical protein